MSKLSEQLKTNTSENIIKQEVIFLTLKLLKMD